MRFPGGRAKALTFSYDDCTEQDIRLARIFANHGLKATFNINTGLFAPEGTVYPEGTVHRRMTKSAARKLYKSGAHEVAVHTLTHPFLERLPMNVVANEVLGDRLNIEEMFGRVTRGMAYPYGTYSDEVVEVLKTCGIAYSRTVANSNSFEIPGDWLRLSPTCHHKSPNLTEFGRKFVNETPSLAPWLFYVWGHSFEFEADSNWNVIEDFADLVSFKEDIWYATNIEIYDYCRAYKALEISADGRLLYNPSCREVFVYVLEQCKTFSVMPGETLTLG